MQVFYNNEWGLEWIPHHLGAVINLIFFPLYKALHGTFLKHTENPMGKIQDSLENSESKGSFSQNTLKSILFDWDLFWPQSFNFNVANHFLIGLWTNLTKGNAQNKA